MKHERGNMSSFISARQLRDDVLSALESIIGTYTFVNGSTAPAIAVLPDDSRGYDYPEYGTRTTGIEVVIEKPYGEIQNPTLGGGANIRYDWMICVKQWDNNASLFAASQILLEKISCKYLVSKVVRIPENNKLDSIEQYKMLIRDWCLTGITRPCISHSIAYLGDGDGINPFIFTVPPPPSIASVSPLTAAAGDNVIITGNFFTGTTAVSFGGVAAASFIVDSDSQITAVVASGGDGSVQVTTPSGTDAFAGFVFASNPEYFNAQVAFSLSKRVATYLGSCIRVRRASDGVEQDIGFAANNLVDESAITTFLAGSDGTVAIWYNQTGLSDASIATPAFQPLIAVAGVVLKDGNLPYVRFFNPRGLEVDTAINLGLSSIATDKTFFSNYISTVASNFDALFSNYNVPFPTANLNLWNTQFRASDSTAYDSTLDRGFPTINLPRYAYGTYDSTTFNVSYENSDMGSGSVVTNNPPPATSFDSGSNFFIGLQGNNTFNPSNYLDGSMHEIIAWDKNIPLDALAPSISVINVSPLTGSINDTITISGAGFRSITSITFGGTLVQSFNIVDDDTVTVVLNAGASGNVVVNTIGGTASFPGFVFV